MSKKFSRVIQAGRLQTALANYQKWLTGEANRQPNIGKKGNRPALQHLFVEPFNLSLPTTVLVQQSGQVAAWEKYGGDIGTHTVATVPSGSSSVKLRGYKAARIRIITASETKGTPKTSHITGLQYLSYGATSVSLPFGKNSNDTTEAAAYASITSVLTNVKTYLVPELV